MPIKIKVIGLGGIGSCLLPILCQYLQWHYVQKGTPVNLALIDGDQFESANSGRQNFSRLGPKATVICEMLRDRFPGIELRAIDAYIDENNAVTLLREGDIVLLGVDNHATRLLVSNRCQDLNNVTLISGGNEKTFGNIQIQRTINGQNLTLPLANPFHPEIMFPEDRNPAELGCQAAAASGDEQLVITNNFAATLMLVALYQVLSNQPAIPDEIYFDVTSGNARRVHRQTV